MDETGPENEPFKNSSEVRSKMNNDRLLMEVIILGVVCGLLSASIYYYRTNFLELTMLQHYAIRASRMGLIYFALPAFWLIGLRKFSFSDLGITTKKLIMSTIMGTAVYAIALIVFIFSIGNPEFDKYFLWSSGMKGAEFIPRIALIALMAVLTDVWTRGMIMMPILKLHGIKLAVLAQNVTWLLAHAYEIELLTGSITLVGALVLTISLGILGDIVAIKTRNIIGLSIGHILLNVIFFGYSFTL